MGWSVYVNGRIKFRGDVDDETAKEILKEFEDVLECEPKYDPEDDEYVFQEVLWMSHVDIEEVNRVANKWKGYLEMAEIAVYTLDDPAYYFYKNVAHEKLQEG